VYQYARNEACKNASKFNLQFQMTESLCKEAKVKYAQMVEPATVKAIK
jgi:hypothetical protein